MWEEQIRQIINEKDNKISETTKEINKEYDSLIKTFEKLKNLAKKFENKKSFTAEEIKEITKILCYHNLGYCCGLAKNCPMRNTALKILGITDEKFKRIKEETQTILLMTET